MREWLENYKKMFGTAANTQAVIGYNAIETFGFYAGLAGRDLTGQKFLAALEYRQRISGHLWVASG